MPDKHKHKKIVLKILEGMDPSEIYCTTYQMRDMYQEVATAMISTNDVMSLSMHHAAALMARSSDKVLDVCCGRCLTLPLLRRNRPQILSYTGVDIWVQNMNHARRWSAGMRIPDDQRLAPNHPGVGEAYYPFLVNLIEADAADMTQLLTEQHLAPFDLILYMASIEHMQKTAGYQSLVECYQLLREGGRMFLTSPNTSENDGTQYAAHLYEWPQDELLQACKDIGFKLVHKVGLLAKARGYRVNLQEEYPELVPVFDRFAEYLPSAWLYALFPVITPDIADEVGFVLLK